MQQLQAQVVEQLLAQTSAQIRARSIKIKAAVEAEYARFFEHMISMIGEFTPAIVASQGVQWSPVSDDWQNRKYLAGVEDPFFYRGLTDQIGRNYSTSRLGRKKNYGVPRLAGVKRLGDEGNLSFESYLENLNAQGKVTEFFGPVTIFYEVSGRGVTTFVAQEDNVVQRVRALARAKSGSSGWASLPDQLKIAIKVAAFRLPSGVLNDEWRLVDYILKRLDPLHEKQWVKINSRYGYPRARRSDKKGKRRSVNYSAGRRNRPIRPMVSPLINWYIKNRIPELIVGALR
jgi:hypothetical protein